MGLCMRAGKVVSGMDAVCEDLKKNKVKLVIVAENASEKTIRQIRYLVERKKVPILVLGTIEENSMAIGKENRAVIGIKDKNIADGIKKICGGEAFGENESL